MKTLEKIRFSSMQGNNWAADASLCQGCQSRFTLFNRKHHCRRCGGLFCNNCTQQRMKLRGQGDSPVRICEPCKRNEEEARYELRHGHKSRKAKGSPKVEAKNDEELLQDIIEEATHSSKSAYAISDRLGARNSMASSSMHEAHSTPDMVEDIIRNISEDSPNSALGDVGSSTPEELRRLAQEEKNNYKILKSRGKDSDALMAFKRGKELERQAAALEIASRKSQKAASARKTDKSEDSELLTNKKQKSLGNRKPEKDNLVNELRELGWSDADVHEVEKKPEKQSLESELSSLLGGSIENKSRGIDKTQVILRKRRALELKREGKLTEAKEELKQAKILEKQLEENEFLGEAEESDDEISALIRNLENEKQEPSFAGVPDPSLTFDFSGLMNDTAFGNHVDITDDDLNDPEMTAALKSFGWSEEGDALTEDASAAASGKNHEQIKGEILALKREAVEQKRVGNLVMARDFLKKAKQLERDLESSSTQETAASSLEKTLMSDFPNKDHLPARPTEDATTTSRSSLKQPPKSKSAIQRELLVLKRKALALKREGLLEEAEEELRKGKILELLLEEMENVSVPPSIKNLERNSFQAANPLQGSPMSLDLPEGGDADVTDQDMKDPTLLSALKNLGWEEDSESVKVMKISEGTPGLSNANAAPLASLKPINKGEIQRELLLVKRRALTLRRQGKTEEADAELKKAGDLENHLKELDGKHEGVSMALNIAEGANADLTSKDMEDPTLLAALNNLGWKEDSEPANRAMKASELVPHLSNVNAAPIPSLKPISKGKIQRELLLVKRKALALRRQGKAEEADEELRKAGHLESQLKELEAKHEEVSMALDIAEGDDANLKSKDMEDPTLLAALNNLGWKEDSEPANSAVKISELAPHLSNVNAAPIPSLKPINKGKIQRELLLVKRKALALRRQGKAEEADEELRKAGHLESQLKELEAKHEEVSMALDIDEGDDANLKSKDMEDPTLLAALNNLGWKENYEPANSAMTISELSPHLSNVNASPISSLKPISKGEIQRELLLVKRKALALRRQGNSEEADEELRKAGHLESQLKELEAKHEDVSMASDIAEGDDADLTNKDMVDPMLLASLNNLGWKEDSEPTNRAMKISELASHPSNVDAAPIQSLKPISKGEIQRELLLVKRKALALRRQGKTEEADEELRKASDLESQLKELEAKHQSSQFGNTVSFDQVESMSAHKEILQGEKYFEHHRNQFEKSNDKTGSLLHSASSEISTGAPNDQGSQHDTLSCMPMIMNPSSRNATVETVGAPEKTKTLVETAIATTVDDNPSHKQNPAEPALVIPPSNEPANSTDPLAGDIDKKIPVDIIPDEKIAHRSTKQDLSQNTEHEAYRISPDLALSQQRKGDENHSLKEIPGDNVPSELDSLKDQILARKRRAVALKREGKLSEAREELKQAKLLQLTLDAGGRMTKEDNPRPEVLTSSGARQVDDDNQGGSASTSTGAPVFQKTIPANSTSLQKPSSRDRFKLQQECLSIKRQVTKLRREGKMHEAEILLEQARDLQSQIEEIDSSLNSNKIGGRVEDDALMESFLDPQLVAALKSVGIGVGDPASKESNSISNNAKMTAPSRSISSATTKPLPAPGGVGIGSEKGRIPTSSGVSSSSAEKAKLEEQIKAERLRALNFKRAGKQAEALDSLRAAKVLEKKLTSLG